MTVKMLVSIASADFAYRPGEVVKVADALGAAWVASGVAKDVSMPAPKVKPVKGKKD